MYIRDQVIVLKKSPYREHDRQYVMYGRIHGLLLAAARGAVKPGAKQASQLEPLTMADVMIAKGRNFDHLAVAVQSRGTKSSVDSRMSSVTENPDGPFLPPEADSRKGQLTSDSSFLEEGESKRFSVRSSLRTLGGLAVAGAFADLCLKLIRPGVADERLFDLWEELTICLNGLPQELTVLRAQLIFAAVSLKLMDALGYGPALSAKCAVCHRPIGPTDAWYAPGHNGLVCSDCMRDSREPAILAMAHAIALLKFMRVSFLSDVLRVSLSHEVAQNALRLIREVWRHAPLNKEPHGLDTIQAIMAV